MQKFNAANACFSFKYLQSIMWNSYDGPREQRRDGDGERNERSRAGNRISKNGETALQRSNKAVVRCKLANKNLAAQLAEQSRVLQLYRDTLVKNGIRLPELTLSSAELQLKITEDLVTEKAKKASLELERLKRENIEAELKAYIEKAESGQGLGELYKKAESLGFKNNV